MAGAVAVCKSNQAVQGASQATPTTILHLQAHLAPVTSQEDVEACMATLLQHNKIRNATHNILAYRIYVKNRDAWLQVTALWTASHSKLF